MILSVASGKGGTGKTLVATSLALSLSDKGKVQLLDCDVEEPNAHIFVKPVFIGRDAVSIPVPRVDESKCTYCGKCSEVCAYNAIAVFKEKVLVFPELCHGCGACSYLCPEAAISEERRELGVIESGNSGGPVDNPGCRQIGGIIVHRILLCLAAAGLLLSAPSLVGQPKKKIPEGMKKKKFHDQLHVLYPDDKDAMMALVAPPPDRLLLGSDFPLITHQRQYRALPRYFASDEWLTVLASNAAQILGLNPSA